MKRVAILLTAVLLALACAAGAQTVYKYTDPNGRTVYTDDPKAGNGTAQRIDAPPPPGAAPAKPAELSELDKKLLRDARRRAELLDRATDDIVTASRALRETEERREQGIEPLEGERIGRRFRPEYWQRQHALEREVQAARAALGEALKRRNALR